MGQSTLCWVVVFSGAVTHFWVAPHFWLLIYWFRTRTVLVKIWQFMAITHLLINDLSQLYAELDFSKNPEK